MTVRTVLLSLFFLVFGCQQNLAEAQEIPTDKIQKAVESWPGFQNSVRFSRYRVSNRPDSARYVGATATISGHNTSVLFEFMDSKKKRVRRILILPPQALSLSTADFQRIVGQDVNNVFPNGSGANIAITRFELICDDNRKNRINGATMDVSLGVWKPFNNDNAFRLTDMRARIGFVDLQSSGKKLLIRLDALMHLPKSLTDAFQIGETQLITTGSINMATRVFVIQAKLKSDHIPLVTDESLVLKEAKVQFAVSNKIPSLALAGRIQVRDNGQAVLPDLNGQVSIDLTGNVYSECWMSDNQAWSNPFNLCKKVHISGLGLGFGANFKTTPIPAPILSAQGGLVVKKPGDSRPRFSGSVTMGVNMGDPSQCMIDAVVPQAYLSDLVDAFYPPGVPQSISNELKKIDFNNLRFTLVPPGPGVTLFGNYYYPGFIAHGAFGYKNHRGAMYIKMSDAGTEAFGEISSFESKGFSLTGATPGHGPGVLLTWKPSSLQAAFALNGKLTVLGVSSLTDIYMTNQGFSATLDGNIYNKFHAGLEVAGGAIDNSASMYVRAYMNKEDNLAQKISQEASQELNRLEDELQRQFRDAKNTLEQSRPQLNTAKRELEAKQAETRIKWEKQCEVVNRRDEQKARQKRKEEEVKQVKAEWESLKDALERDRWRSATRLNETTCPGKSKKGPDDFCYTPKPGYMWEIGRVVNGPMATYKPKKVDYKPAEHVGYYTPFKKTNKTCPSGQFGELATRKCYKCPSGYVRDGGLYRCKKVTPRQNAYAEKGSYVGCGQNGSFRDIGTTACWKCPTGYERKASTFPITGPKACALVNLGERQAEVRKKKENLDLLNIELNVLVRGLEKLGAELSGVAESVCADVSNTAVINADPAVSPYFNKWFALDAKVNKAQAYIDLVEKTQVGGLRAMAWMAENGGEAFGIVQINSASFEGCLSTVSGGTVALNVSGLYAGKPLNASFKINMYSPEKDIKQFANMLLINPNPKAVYSNGSCTKPNVPRPVVDNEKIKELMEYVRTGKKLDLPGPVPERDKRPAWAAEKKLLR